MKIKKKKNTSDEKIYFQSGRYVSTFFAIYSRKQKSKNDIGRSSDLLPYLNAFPFPKIDSFCGKSGQRIVQYVIKELTAAGTVPDFHRIPFCLLFRTKNKHQ
jgi:hypothetical protein